jgi:hypothetical protein
MIPPFAAGGNLPPGIHWATWEEIVDRFGGTEDRQHLLDGLRLALFGLRAAGCRTVYVDGSFVTSKTDPGDFDACWERNPGMSTSNLDPIFYDFEDDRAAQKARFGGELFPADAIADIYGNRFVDFFQIDKEIDERK